MLFWFLFSRIRTECEETQSNSPYSVRMRESRDQNNSEYGHFSRSVNEKDFHNFRVKNFHLFIWSCCTDSISGSMDMRESSSGLSVKLF